MSAFRCRERHLISSRMTTSHVWGRRKSRLVPFSN